MLLVVPNELRDAINAKIDQVLDGRPIDEAERADVYDTLLLFYDEHGVIPDFSLNKRN